MKKTGFTLAEVLITLAILGVVAALTLPGLNRNVAQRQIGPKLAKAINTLENANQSIISDYNARLIDDVTSIRGVEGAPNYPQILESVMAATLRAGTADNTFILTGKDGIAYIVPTTTDSANNVSNLPIKYNGSYYKVTIDIDGVQSAGESSDKGGSDQFLVYVDRSGIVIPAGGKEWKKYSGSDEAKNCVKGGAPDANCTAAIVENNWKVPY